MSSLPLWGYAAILGVSLLLSLVLTPVALRVASRHGVLDHPRPGKAHIEAVPYLGGAAIVLSFALIVLVATALRPPPSGLAQLAGFLGIAVLLALIGLLDDLRGGLSPWLRLGLEAGAGVVVWLLGNDAHLAGVPGWLNAVVTVIWVVGVTNAFNLLDNMDGLSAGVAAVASLTIFGVAALQTRYLVAALAIALAGCAAGFLRNNFHPAKILLWATPEAFFSALFSRCSFSNYVPAQPRECRGDPRHSGCGALRHDAGHGVKIGSRAPPFRRWPGPRQPPPGTTRHVRSPSSHHDLRCGRSDGRGGRFDVSLRPCRAISGIAGLLVASVIVAVPLARARLRGALATSRRSGGDGGDLEPPGNHRRSRPCCHRFEHARGRCERGADRLTSTIVTLVWAAVSPQVRGQGPNAHP